MRDQIRPTKPQRMIPSSAPFFESANGNLQHSDLHVSGLPDNRHPLPGQMCIVLGPGT